MQANSNADHITTAVLLRDSQSEGIQRSHPASGPLRMSLADRRVKKIVLDRPLDMWVEFLRQQAKKFRVWLDTTCGCSQVTAFVERQAEKLSVGFDAACSRYGFTHFWRPQAERLRVWSVGITQRISTLIGGLSFPMLVGWCGFAAVVLLVSLIAHVSTFSGIDPMAKWPGVMFIHLAVFPPFIAAGCYASRAGSKKDDGQDRVFQSAPRWLRIVTGVFFVYAFVNFALFLALNEGGGPDKREEKYFLTSHGKILREISEEEYHRQQAYVVRGFSGHWMLFSCAALTMLVGTLRLHRQSSLSLTPTEPEAKGRPSTTTAFTEGKHLDGLRNGDRLAR